MGRVVKAIAGIAIAAAAVVGSILLPPTAPLLASMALSAAASLGLGLAAQSLAGVPNQGQAFSGVKGQLQGGGVVPRSFIHGRWATAGSLGYSGTFGTDGQTPNAYFVKRVDLSDLPLVGLAGLFVDGQACTYDAGAAPGVHGIAIPQFTVDGKQHLWVRFYSGSQTTADAQLLVRFGAHPTRPYPADMVGRGCAYAVVTALVNGELFQGFPDFKFVLDGINLYDLRLDTTAGGAGAQRFDTPATWGGSGNGDPAILIYNILRGIAWNGQWLYGLQNVAAGRLPASNWMAGANECDLPITNADASVEPQYRTGGEINVNDPPAEVIEQALTACNGRLAEVGGIYKIHVGAAGPAVFAFTDDNIVVTEPQDFTPFFGIGEAINGITARYVSPPDGWNPKEAPPRYRPDLEDEDGGRRLLAGVEYGRVSSGTQVQRLMVSALAEARRARRHSMVLPPEAWALEPNDVVSWTSARNGYTAKLLRVDGMVDLANLDQLVNVTEVDPADYDWVAATQEKPESFSPLVMVRPPPQPIVDWNAQGIVIQGDGGQLPGILLSWDPDQPDIDGVQYQVKLFGAGDADLILDSQTDAWERGAIKVSQNLVRVTQYQARGKYRAKSDRKTSWSGWLAVTTPDVRVEFDQLSAEVNAHLALLTNNAEGSLRQLRERALELIEQLAHDAALELGVAYEERKVIRSQGSTTARQTSVLQAEVVGAKALVVAESTARASADEALASDIILVEATANQGTASGLIKLEAASAPAGVTARFAVYLKASAGDTFKDAGFYLDIVGGVARAIFKVDQFAVTSGGAAALLPFAVSGGNVYVGNDLVVTGSIIANGVTETTSAFTAAEIEIVGDTLEYTLQSLAVTKAANDRLLFLINIYGDNKVSNTDLNAQAIQGQFNLMLYRDAVLVRRIESMLPIRRSSSGFTYKGNVTIIVDESDLSAGTYTYTLKVSNQNFPFFPPAPSLWFKDRLLVAQKTKR